MMRPTLPRYSLSKSERNKFNRRCKAWDLAERKCSTVTEEDFEQAYSVLRYVGRLASLDYKNSVNDNDWIKHRTDEHRKNLVRAEKARHKAMAMLQPYNATIKYYGCMPTVVEINTNRDLMLGHW